MRNHSFLLFCQNFAGCHLEGCFAARLATCVPLQMHSPCPVASLGHCPDCCHLFQRSLPCGSAAGLLGDLGRVILPLRSPLSCSLPCLCTGTGLLPQGRYETAQRCSWPRGLPGSYPQEQKERTRLRHCTATLLPALSSAAET